MVSAVSGAAPPQHDQGGRASVPTPGPTTSTTDWCTDAFLHDIPKCDLHVHLDGSLRLETLVDLMEGVPNLALPTNDIDELKQQVFKPRFESLEDYLTCFMYTVGVMQTGENVERIAYEFAVDNYAEGVRYFEVRFAPQLLSSPVPADNFTIADVLTRVNTGLHRAQQEANTALEAAQAKGERQGEPTYEYGIIACAIRKFDPGMSRYYDALFALHPHATVEEMTSMASVNLVLAVREARDDLHLPIVAIDIAGAERDNEATVHADAFKLAHKFSFATTVHAGEGFGPESIHQALRSLGADRIGHGFHLFSEDMMSDEMKGDPEAVAKYIKTLVKYIGDRRITLEVCLTSNTNTMPDLTMRDHALRRMLQERLSVTLATDNRLMSNTSMVNELRLAVHTFDLTPRQLREIVVCGFKRSFYHGPYTVRRAYVRRVMDYYDQVAAKHGVPHATYPCPTTTT